MAKHGTDLDWNHARAFLLAVEEGSFSAAARALGTSQPTVGRQIAALEAELGVLLFDRVGTRRTLTPTGQDLAEHVRAMMDAATRFSMTAAGQSGAVEGSVSITASETISAYLLPPILGSLRADYPGIEIELVVSNATKDLLRRESDIAVRNYRPEDADLIARRLPDRRGLLYASPAYLARLGDLSQPEVLEAAEFFAFDRTQVMIDGFRAVGLHVRREQFPIVTGNHHVQWSLCRAGVGICVMMESVGRAEPGVVPVLPHLEFPVPMWLVCHRELHTSQRIRIVYERLAEGLA